MTQEPHRDALATRRAVLAGAGIAGLAGMASGCASAAPSSTPASVPTGPGAPSAIVTATATDTGGAASGGPVTASGAGGGQAANVLGSTSEVPVGGGMIFTAKKVVVTQPSAGEFKGFSAVCTHMGCIVSQIVDGSIRCPCHGSQYSIKNGSVVGGPAPSPLPAEAIKVDGDSIVLR